MEVREYNEKISQEMGEIVERVEARERKIIIVGYFNSHLGYIGYQEENRNGRIMNRFLNKYDLILMNIDERCKGVYTWERGEMKSVIDYVVVNREMYDRVEEVVVDEERKETEISDHCMLSTFLRVGRPQGGGGDGCWIAQKYFRYSEERVQRYRLQVEEKLETGGQFSMTEINKILLEAAEQHLSTEYRRREKEGETEQPWITQEIRREIGKRRQLNKKHRGAEEEDRKEKWERYLSQKGKVKELIRAEMRKYEEKLTEGIRGSDRGSKLWDQIDKLRGREKGRKQLSIDGEDGVKLNDEEKGEEIRRCWSGIHKMHIKQYRRGVE